MSRTERGGAGAPWTGSARPELRVSGPLGATRVGPERWRFVVWAPRAEQVLLHVTSPADRSLTLERVGRAYHVGEFDALTEGDRYRFVLDDGEYADPVSRSQPDGVYGPSALFDPSSYRWSDEGFVAVPLEKLVIYELHVGTFSAAGTFAGAIPELGRLARLGVNAVEAMPIAAFPGVRNWGYDGAFPFAVQQSYGGPGGFQEFVDVCHECGLAVILDVVYNHLGPEGSVLSRFAPYVSDHYETPWGAAMNVDQAGSDEVRRYFIENACSWCADFHVDGLRLDAVHAIIDTSAYPFVAELCDAVHAQGAALGRELFVIAESADNNPRVITPTRLGGLGCDAQWSDDFHHGLHVLVTGERDRYYRDYEDPELLARAVTGGFAYTGQYSSFRDRRYGRAPSGARSSQFVVAAQNHDQIGNRAGAERLSSLISAALLRVVAAALLLGPHLPLLFMGEEYAEVAPFPYFVDPVNAELLDVIRAGRAAEFGGEDRYDPGLEETFRRATLATAAQRSEEQTEIERLYERLLRLRSEVELITDPCATTRAEMRDRTLVLERRRPKEALVAACNFSEHETLVRLPPGEGWSLLLCAEEAECGGRGNPAPSHQAGGAVVPVRSASFWCYLERGVHG